MDDPAWFWVELPPHDPDMPTASGSILQDAERALSVRFPPTFASLMTMRNGGMPRYRAISIPSENPNSNLFPQPLILSNIITLDHVRDQTYFDYDKALYTNLVHFAFCQSPEHLVCFDYNSSESRPEPPVACCMHWTCGPKVVEICSSFDDFIAGLFLSERRDCYGFASNGAQGNDIWRTIVNAFRLQERESILTPTLGWKFTGVHPAWASSTSDSVERDKCAFRLAVNKDGVNDTAFPEYPQCDWILRVDAHPQHRVEIQAILESLPFPSIPLHLVDWTKWKHLYRTSRAMSSDPGDATLEA